TNPFYQSYAGDIYQSGHLLLSLINDILDLSKIEAGKYQLHLETLDLRDVIHGALHMVEKDAREAGLSLTLQMTEAPASLLADRRAVIRIILNLLSNAIKFTPTGGSVELHCATGESGATIVVTDSGIGMAPGEIPIALTAFGQLDNAYARDHRGTGLGLPMVKSLAEQHGGRLEIESQPGKGTTVTVWLPGRADLVQQM
ncbi:MAG TPA: HAMP domain-containing sensor histidine kinase, partial [Terriglobales bacterium]|nr:HAMP domain-containing sensor histidine kinase [Terriglobales bacterium]